MVIIQNIIADNRIDEKSLKLMTEKILVDFALSKSELVIRLVDRDEIQSLNHQYRKQNKPTNVLAFPVQSSLQIKSAVLGDVVICPEVVQHEATAQNKSFANHLSHIALHGLLHLLGYTHEKTKDTEIMQALEVKILQKFNIHNPYITFFNK